MPTLAEVIGNIPAWDATVSFGEDGVPVYTPRGTILDSAKILGITGQQAIDIVKAAGSPGGIDQYQYYVDQGMIPRNYVDPTRYIDPASQATPLAQLMKAAYPAAYNYISQKIGPNATPLAFDQAASDTMVALNGDSSFTKITSPNDVNSWGASAQYLNSAITGLGSTLGFNPNSGVIPASVFNTSPSSGASTSIASGYEAARPDLFAQSQNQSYDPITGAIDFMQSPGARLIQAGMGIGGAMTGIAGAMGAGDVTAGLETGQNLVNNPDVFGPSTGGATGSTGVVAGATGVDANSVLTPTTIDTSKAMNIVPQGGTGTAATGATAPPLETGLVTGGGTGSLDLPTGAGAGGVAGGAAGPVDATLPSWAGGAGTTAAAGTAATGSPGIFDTFLQNLSNSPVQTAIKAAQVLSGIGSGVSTMNKPISPSAAQQMADPFASSRQQYIDKLNAVMANPSLTMSQPGYQFALQEGMQGLNRSLAKSGMGTATPGAPGTPASGAAGIAQQKYGQNYATTAYNNYVNQLAGLAGATQNPSVGSNAYMSAQKAASDAATAGWQGISQASGGLASLFGKTPQSGSGTNAPATGGSATGGGTGMTAPAGYNPSTDPYTVDPFAPTTSYDNYGYSSTPSSSSYDYPQYNDFFSVP